MAHELDPQTEFGLIFEKRKQENRKKNFHRAALSDRESQGNLLQMKLLTSDEAKLHWSRHSIESLPESGLRWCEWLDSHRFIFFDISSAQGTHEMHPRWPIRSETTSVCDVGLTGQFTIINYNWYNYQLIDNFNLNWNFNWLPRNTNADHSRKRRLTWKFLGSWFLLFNFENFPVRITSSSLKLNIGLSHCYILQSRTAPHSVWRRIQQFALF